MDKEYKEGDSVQLEIKYHTNLGYRVAVNGKDDGMLFHSEIFQELEDGDEVKGFIKKIHEDGKIDVSLRPQGFRNVIGRDVNKILKRLEKSGGTLYLSDKSDPKDIKSELNMSKKAFKKAVGNLYRNKRIIILDNCIKLAEEK